MAAPPAAPVPPVPPAPVPAPVDAPVSRRTQVVALLLLSAIAGLIGWRWYSDRNGARPTELTRELTHRIDLNRATKSELMQIPGVGPQLAERIVGFRDTNGPFGRVEDLSAVHGIGDATLNKLRPWVSVSPGETEVSPQTEPDRLTRKPAPSGSGSKKPGAVAGPINVNTASVAELQTLPGIGPVLAQRIVTEREKRPFAKVDELRRVSGIGPKKLEAIRPLVTVGE
jgi:competence protein ComEA